DVLQADLFGAYPMIFVGVTQPALEHDEQRLDNWGTRRTGRLLHRTLVEFLGAGPEGGQYQLPLGSIDRSEDNRQMVLRLSNSATRRVTGYDVSQRLLELASPATPDYQPAWASLLDQIAVKDVFGVEIGLKRPHVLPEALLRVPLQRRDAAPDAEGSGEFRVQARLARELQFAHKSFRTGGRLAELVELTFDGSDEGLSALRRREIDVLDRVFPADALRVREESAADSPIRIEPYALPTVHVLVPNTQNPFLANRNFRRAILLGIDRETILRQELMGGRNYPGFQVISGPFPASAGESDPLGYAYDESTRPLPYYPLLAKVLTIAFTKEVADTAAKRGDPAPQLKPLRLGYPGYELARVACQAIAAQLQLIGLQVELNEFPLGVSDDTGQECDLVYKDIALWEPVTDARRILGPEGVAPTESPYVQQSLRWLEEAENWGEARERLVDIHRAVYNDVAVLPLWQTVDFLAYHRRIQNVGPNPVWLYQNVDQWRISSEAGAE
ncbi:MAG: ABC transporter substrate-binding protein, partial [Pirellulaceae bacterium]